MTTPTPPPGTTEFGGRDWTTYYQAVAGKPPRDTLLRALQAFDAVGGPARGRSAIDLGCGEGRDTRELLRRGWSVLAIDPHPDAARRFGSSMGREGADEDPLSAPGLHPRCVFMRSTLERAAARPEFAPPAGFDLVNASFVLPFVPPAPFGGVWSWIRSVIARDGRFAGQFFGPRDSWASIPGRSHHSREQVHALVEGLEIEQLVEDEKDGADAEGNPKHWHVFHVVARQIGEAAGAGAER